MSLNAKGLKVVFWNIQSQYSKPVFVTDFVESNNFDVMVLNETWLREDITDNFISIRNYSLYRQDRAEMTSFNTTKRGGGIAIYIKNTIQYVLMDSNVFCYNTKDIESCCIKLIFERIRPIYIVAVYRPPSGSVHNFGKALVDTCQLPEILIYLWVEILKLIMKYPVQNVQFLKILKRDLV